MKGSVKGKRSARPEDGGGTQPSGTQNTQAEKTTHIADEVLHL